MTTVDPQTTRPTALVLGDQTIPVRNWRDVYVKLVEECRRTMKEVPATWIKDEKHRTLTALADGKFLYTNLANEQMLVRIRHTVGLLNVPCSVKTEGGASLVPLIPQKSTNASPEHVHIHLAVPAKVRRALRIVAAARGVTMGDLVAEWALRETEGFLPDDLL